MFSLIKNAFNKVKKIVSVGILAPLTMAITYSWGLVTFEEADKWVLDKWVGNTISNLWAGFKFVLPYIWTFVGVSLVIWGVYFLVRRARS